MFKHHAPAKDEDREGVHMEPRMPVRLPEDKRSPFSSTMLKIFNPMWLTIMFINFANTGFGLCLAQENPKDPKSKKLIWCSSKRHKTLWEAKLPPVHGESHDVN